MTISTAAAAQRSLKRVELMAARMAEHPDQERSWAIERIRVVAEAGYIDDAEVRQEVREVLAGLDLAEQRRAVR
jgi:signal transduction histidine kinase